MPKLTRDNALKEIKQLRDRINDAGLSESNALVAQLDQASDLLEFPRPTPKANPDYSPLVSTLEEGMQSVVDNDGYPGKDFTHYVFEEAMKCVYGEDVFQWWNKNSNY